jgi:hypothetical protein
MRANGRPGGDRQRDPADNRDGVGGTYGGAAPAAPHFRLQIADLRFDGNGTSEVPATGHLTNNLTHT